MRNFEALRRNKTVRYGIPMILLVVGGSFGLREFAQLRYDALKFKSLDPALVAKVDVEKQAVMLEDQFEKMQSKNLDGWKNIRGPRPWEDSKEYQDMQRNNQNKKA